MATRHVGDRDGLAVLRITPRFVVLITNPRLVHGRFARMAIREAAGRLPEVPFEGFTSGCATHKGGRPGAAAAREPPGSSEAHCAMAIV
jgi:hypothetical protein